MRIASVIASRNRRTSTISMLEELTSQASECDVNLFKVLVDDDSSDGTRASAMKIPSTYVVHGSGDLFWGGAMRLGTSEALRFEPTAVLWLNDDVKLRPDSLERAIAAYQYVLESGAPFPIIVGACSDSSGTDTTYSGYIEKRGLFTHHLERVAPSHELLEVDSMNGNFVLADSSAFSVAGHIDAVFRHTLGDLDFGLRARNAGCTLRLMSDYIGQCDRNPVSGTSADISLPLARRIRRLIEVKELPPKAWARFLRRHSGPFWYIQWVYTYIHPITDWCSSWFRSRRHLPERRDQ